MSDEHEREIAREAVEETLQRLGLDTNDPQGMRRDLAALREFRMARDKGKAAAIWALATAAVGGVLTLILDFFKTAGK